ncbi:MAG: hypothetical protein AAGC70_10405 [Pseudomonadota bacterium]
MASQSESKATAPDRTSGTPYRTRLDALFAADGRTAVILRRGPKRFYQLLTWDLATDRFVHGQWMVGEIQITDLSHDGSKLLYWAQQHRRATRVLAKGEQAAPPQFEPLDTPTRPVKTRRNRRIPRYLREASGQPVARRRRPVRPIETTWTAISTPPYFSALAVWPARDGWDAGGRFLPDGSILLQLSEDDLTPHFNVTPTRQLYVKSWRSDEFSRRAVHPMAYRPWLGDSRLAREVALALRDAGARWVEWVNARAGPDLLFACDGCIYRLGKFAEVAPAEYLSRATKLVDVSGATFEAIAPPASAMRW